MRDPYPPFDAYKTEMLDVGSGHRIYVEQSGNPEGQPVIVFHGGPGGSCKPKNRQFFDPKKYRVILFDQRGCGQSLFEDLLKDNTTQDLISDAEKIRTHLNIEKWHVYGGSWGSTLALAYTEKNPGRVISLLVRGIYYGTKAEDAWLFGGGAQKFFPDAYQKMADFMREQGLKVSPDNLRQLILSENEALANKAAQLSDDWEGAVCQLIPDAPGTEANPYAKEQDELLNSKKIMFHYTSHNCFLQDNELLDNSYKLKGIPTAIIQGRYDLICPFEGAWKLHLALPNADFKIIPDAGHYSGDAGTTAAIIEYTDRFAGL